MYCHVQSRAHATPGAIVQYETAARQIAEKLERDLSIQSVGDWYTKLTRKAIKAHEGGADVMKALNFSLERFMACLYPDHQWNEWLFKQARVPGGYWKSHEIQRRYYQWISKELQIKNLADWYRIKPAMVQGRAGDTLLHEHFDGSLSLYLKTMEPNHEWQPWLFDSVPRSFWTSDIERKRFMDWCGKELGVKVMGDWYKVTIKQLNEVDAYRLLRPYYKGSLYSALKSVYPDHEWLEWNFKLTPKNFWDDIANRKKFIEWLGPKFGIKSLEDWYRADFTEVGKVAGQMMIHKYGRSFTEAIKATYPEHPWLDWRWRQVPRHFWSKADNRANFVKWVGVQKGYNTLEDWYAMTKEQFEELGGRSVLYAYKDSVSRTLKATFPDHEWQEWRFPAAPNAFWESVANRRRFMDWASVQLGVKSMEDWERITIDQISKVGGRTMLHYHNNSLATCLADLYPSHPWKRTSSPPQNEME